MTDPTSLYATTNVHQVAYAGSLTVNPATAIARRVGRIAWHGHHVTLTFKDWAHPSALAAIVRPNWTKTWTTATDHPLARRTTR